MPKILVDAPTGLQEVIDISETGSYFDETRVLWDERISGPLPEITLGGMVRQGDELVFDQTRMDEHTLASAPPVPPVVTMRQARRALLEAGMLQAIPAAIASLPSPYKERAEIDWEYSQDVHRDWPLVLQLAPALGLTTQQIDQLFITAATM